MSAWHGDARSLGLVPRALELVPRAPAVPSWLRRETRDPRLWQIATLAALLAWNLLTLSLGAALVPSLVAIVAAVLAQGAFARLFGQASADLRSPLITGLSLALLLRGDALWVPAAAACVAIASKFLVRYRGKHLFNPAAFAIGAMLLSGHAWVSPGQWGSSVLIVAAMASLAILVLTRAARLDLALTFVATFAALLTAHAAALGDPMTIPLHQMQSGALLLFAFFMITDPRTTPRRRGARVAFAVVLAVVAHWLVFVADVRPGLYVALIATSGLVPVLDGLGGKRSMQGRRMTP